jgi:hypothetical protein
MIFTLLLRWMSTVPYGTTARTYGTTNTVRYRTIGYLVNAYGTWWKTERPKENYIKQKTLLYFLPLVRRNIVFRSYSVFRNNKGTLFDRIQKSKYVSYRAKVYGTARIYGTVELRITQNSPECPQPPRLKIHGIAPKIPGQLRSRRL